MFLKSQYLYKPVDAMINKISNLDRKKYFSLHLYGVAQYAAFFATCRGLNMEIAATSGLLHDIYVVQTGVEKDHAHHGAEMAEKILKEMGQFSEEEIHLIKHAIYFHSDKETVHSEYDEILKDADVVQFYLYQPSDEHNYTESRMNRINQIIKQFSIQNHESVDGKKGS